MNDGPVSKFVRFIVALLCLGGAFFLGAGDLMLNLFSVEQTRQAEELDIYKCFAVGCTLASAGLGCVGYLTRSFKAAAGSFCMIIIGGLFSLTAASTGFALNDKAHDDVQEEINSLKEQNALLAQENQALMSANGIANKTVDHHGENISGCSKINSFKTCDDNYAGIDSARNDVKSNIAQVKANNQKIAKNNQKIVSLRKGQTTKMSSSLKNKTGINGDLIQIVMTFAMAFGIPLSINALMLGFICAAFPNRSENVPRRKKMSRFQKFLRTFKKGKGKSKIKDVELTDIELQKIKNAKEKILKSGQKVTIERTQNVLKDSHSKGLQRAKVSYGLNVLKSAG